MQLESCATKETKKSFEHLKVASRLMQFDLKMKSGK
jgi:hypothetical protein